MCVRGLGPVACAHGGQGRGRGREGGRRGGDETGQRRGRGGRESISGSGEGRGDSVWIQRSSFLHGFNAHGQITYRQIDLDSFLLFMLDMWHEEQARVEERMRSLFGTFL